MTTAETQPGRAASQQPPEHGRVRRPAAEAIGTSTLVFAGCGAMIVDASTGALGHEGAAAAFGLAVGS